MKELEIGETITIKCVEGKESFRCSECILAPEYNCTLLNFPCSSYERKDGKNVHFEMVENPQKEWLNKAVKYIDENVGTMTAIALRKFMEENDYTELQKRNEAYLNGRKEKEEDMRMMLDSQRKELIDKVCEWLEDNLKGFCIIDQVRVYDVTNALHKAMEESK